MPIASNCQICGKLTHALVNCMFCGTLVCNNCVDQKTGVCKRCKAKLMKS